MPSLLWSQLAFSDGHLLLSPMVLLPESSQHLLVSPGHCPLAGLATSFSHPQPQVSSKIPAPNSLQEATQSPGQEQHRCSHGVIFTELFWDFSGNMVIYALSFGEVSNSRELCLTHFYVCSFLTYDNLPFIDRVPTVGYRFG